MVSPAALSITEGRRWQGIVVTPSKFTAFRSVALRLIAADAKAIYQEIEAETKVPWFVVAVIHEREASQNFRSQLGQGDPLNAVSRHVPKGRGPFKTFKEGAVDALVNCAPKAARWTDWSIGGILTILEEYNGLGYASMGRPSPYDWAGTNQYVTGKYTGDGHFDINAVDSQLGCAGLLLLMQQLDPSIKFGVTPTGSVPTTRLSPSKPAVPVVPMVHDAPPLVPQQGPSVTNPAAGSIGDAIAKIFSALFSHLHT